MLTTSPDPERDPFVSLASTNIPLMYEWFHHELSIIASPSGEMFDDTARFVCCCTSNKQLAALETWLDLLVIATLSAACQCCWLSEKIREKYPVTEE